MRGNRKVLALGILAAMVVTIGCSSGSGKSKYLASAVYARDVPVFQGAAYDEMSGNEAWGDEPGSYTKGTTWWFKTKASKAELLAFYEKLYPNAEKLELDTGVIQLRWVPEGATRFEDVTIVVGDGELRIAESVAPKDGSGPSMQIDLPPAGESGSDSDSDS